MQDKPGVAPALWDEKIRGFAWIGQVARPDLCEINGQLSM